MTYDLVVLTQLAPDAQSLVDSMVAADDTLRVRGSGDGAIIQLCDETGRPLVSIEAAQPVEVTGEVERLLGTTVTAGLTLPYWWVEARAAGGAPAPALAHRFAAALVERLGGAVWPPSPPRGDRETA
ncbi:hypothetical protein E1293_10875 [Actinomadura darangshiensis]|uniref:Uncharacterized protein n=1 Tax=Actinomadura darangshiensis TaxID=705336 RepID=A0A4R5BGQ4_9ACTN|nr:hypothetical protein [Actinomadura darangshiensis]TDD85601.1 hypothetical protein E1293_10875 [Actinomadura darangshiensis]